jgi:lipopolysaccharide transport system ATP-binding protein
MVSIDGSQGKSLMNSDGSSIRVNGVGKAYRRYTSHWRRALDLLSPSPTAAGGHRNWVLRDVSFAVHPGESVGIIGQNGAGKSTLLKIITGTVNPTEGSVEVAGQVAALLELGMGFHPDFTGRQNAYMAGQLLGFSVETISERMGDIEAFAEIGDYIDEPIRTYSSGMVVRLAFSVATVIRPQILIVDEALAVGDVFFQQKCYERIKAFVSQGTTLLFVSHGANIILELCDRAILLDHGRVKLDGSPKDVIDLYQAQMVRRMDSRPDAVIVAEKQAADSARAKLEAAQASLSSVETPAPESIGGVDQIGAITSKCVTLEQVQLLRTDGTPASVFVCGESARIRIAYRAHRALSEPHVGFKLRNPFGVVMYESNTYCMGKSLPAVAEQQLLVVEFSVCLRMGPGDYSLSASMANIGAINTFKEALNMQHDQLGFHVVAPTYGTLWTGLVDVSPTLTVSTSPSPAQLKSAA